MAWVTNFMDGFDHYLAADIAAKWDGTQLATTMDTTNFRNSGQSLRISSSSANSVSKRLSAPTANVVMGCAVRLTNAPTAAGFGNSGDCLFALANYVDGGDFDGQFAIGVFSDGKLRVARARGFSSSSANVATLLGTGIAALATNTWYYIEMRVFIHASAGAVEVRVNGVADITLTGVNTKGATSSVATAEYFQLRSPAGSAVNLDDLYVRTESSATEVTGGFLGDVKVKPYYPNGDGTYSAMTCSTGTTHYTLVDESTPNTTDYVSSSTALQKDSYNFQDASETGSIKAVQVSAYSYKADAGFRGVDVFVKSGATEAFAASQPLSTTGKYAMKVWDQDPNTSADWSQTNLNAAEFGVRISADL